MKYCPLLAKSYHVVKPKYCATGKTHLKKEKGSTITRKVIIEALVLFDWITILNEENIHVQYSKHCDAYKKGKDKFVSKFKIEARNDQTWFTDKWNGMRENNQLLWNRFRRYRSLAVYEKYKSGRKEYTQTQMKEAY